MTLPIDPPFVLSGFLVGLLVGQTGVGGGSLMTPILMLVFGVAPGTAVGTDLLYAAVTKTVGTVVHGKHGTVDWVVVRRLASGSLPATCVTLLLMARTGFATMPGGVIPTVLGVALLLTAAALIFHGRFAAITGRWIDRLTARQVAGLTVAVGAGLGVLVTVSSVGAGALGSTALLMLYPRRRMAVIVGSDIAHAVPLTLLAGAGHWMIGSVDLGLLASLLCGSVPGIILGSQLAVRISDRVLRPVLAVVLIVVGGRLVF